MRRWSDGKGGRWDIVVVILRLYSPRASERRTRNKVIERERERALNRRSLASCAQVTKVVCRQISRVVFDSTRLDSSFLIFWVEENG